MSEKDIVRVIYNEGEEKPWEVSLEDVGLLGTARAVLNHPGRHFETQQEAIETAEKIKDLIKADSLEVQASPAAEGEVFPLAEGDTSVTPADEDTVRADYRNEDHESVVSEEGVTGYPEPVSEGVFMDDDRQQAEIAGDDGWGLDQQAEIAGDTTVDGVSQQESIAGDTRTASEEYHDLAVDDELSSPEPTEYQDYTDEEVSTSEVAPARSASFFGNDGDSEDRVRADEYRHPEEVDELHFSETGDTNEQSSDAPGGLPPRPVPPSSVSGEGK